MQWNNGNKTSHRRDQGNHYKAILNLKEHSTGLYILAMQYWSYFGVGLISGLVVRRGSNVVVP